MRVKTELQTFDIKLIDNAVTAALQHQFPLDLTITARAGVEFYGKLSDALATTDAAATSQIKSGALYYYPDWQALSFQLKDLDISPYTMIYLGELPVQLVTLLQETDRQDFIVNLS